MSPATTHYAEDGVAETASTAQIQTAFRKLALTNHPDKGGDKANFTRVREAQEVLSVPARRQKYDNELACQREADLSSDDGDDEQSSPSRTPSTEDLSAATLIRHALRELQRRDEAARRCEETQRWQQDACRRQCGEALSQQRKQARSAAKKAEEKPKARKYGASKAGEGVGGEGRGSGGRWLGMVRGVIEGNGSEGVEWSEMECWLLVECRGRLGSRSDCKAIALGAVFVIADVFVRTVEARFSMPVEHQRSCRHRKLLGSDSSDSSGSTACELHQRQERGLTPVHPLHRIIPHDHSTVLPSLALSLANSITLNPSRLSSGFTATSLSPLIAATTSR